MKRSRAAREVKRNMEEIEAKHSMEAIDHEEAIFTLHIFDALYDLLWHDILNFFTLPLGIRDVHNTNWDCIHGKFTIRDYFRTLFREIIG